MLGEILWGLAPNPYPVDTPNSLANMTSDSRYWKWLCDERPCVIKKMMYII